MTVPVRTLSKKPVMEPARNAQSAKNAAKVVGATSSEDFFSYY